LAFVAQVRIVVCVFPMRADSCSMNKIFGRSLAEATKGDVVGIWISQANALVRADAFDAAGRAYGVTKLTRPFVAAPHGALVH
jgi:hypothetical protein